MKNFDYSRIWFLTDIHFGLHSFSMEWLDITTDYFESFFIPLLEEKKRDDDILVILGDVFDNRQSVNIKVLYNAKRVFNKLAKLIDIHIIVGNHDIYMKNSNDISSIDVLEDIPNIHIWKEPEVVSYNNRRVLLMPWRKDPNTEAECVNSNEADYLFCHTDVRGMRYNRASKVDHGNYIAVYKKFKKVFSGHIHYRQHVDNIIMLGSPFEMTRSDAYNTKAVYLWDLEDENCSNLEIFKNNYSPKHLKLQFEDIKDYKIEDIRKMIENNFVDIYVNNSFLIRNPIASFLNKISNSARKLETYVQYDDSGDNATVQSEEDIRHTFSMNISNLLKTYVGNNYNSVEGSDQLKAKLLSKLNDIIKRVNA